MSLKRRLQQLERQQRDGGDFCPHLPLMVIPGPEYAKCHRWLPVDLWRCPCGLPQQTITIEYVDTAGAPS